METSERLISKSGQYFATIDTDYYCPEPDYEPKAHIVYNKNADYQLGNEPVDPETFRLPTDCVAVPVYAYIHGAVAIAASNSNPFAMDPQEWDSGVSGYAYYTREDIEAVGIQSDEAARKQLINAVNEYGDWLEGDCYSIALYKTPEGADPEAVDTDELESLDMQFGLIGYRTAIEEAKACLTYFEQRYGVQLSLLDV